MNSRTEIVLIMKKIWFGDWFILMQLCKNMQPGEVLLTDKDFMFKYFRDILSPGHRPL